MTRLALLHALVACVVLAACVEVERGDSAESRPIHATRRVDGMIGSELPLDDVGSAPAPWKQYRPSIAFGGSQYLVTWSDSRNTKSTVYAARISSNGVVLDPVGIPISSSSGNAHAPRVAAGGGIFMVTWTEDVGATSEIRAARVNATGAVLDPGGFVVSAQPVSNDASSSVAWGSGAFLVVFEEQAGHPCAAVRHERSSSREHPHCLQRREHTEDADRRFGRNSVLCRLARRPKQRGLRSLRCAHQRLRRGADAERWLPRGVGAGRLRSGGQLRRWVLLDRVVAREDPGRRPGCRRDAHRRERGAGPLPAGCGFDGYGRSLRRDRLLGRSAAGRMARQGAPVRSGWRSARWSSPLAAPERLEVRGRQRRSELPRRV